MNFNLNYGATLTVPSIENESPDLPATRTHISLECPKLNASKCSEILFERLHNGLTTKFYSLSPEGSINLISIEGKTDSTHDSILTELCITTFVQVAC